jgi:hypothetical protein
MITPFICSRFVDHDELRYSGAAPLNRELKIEGRDMLGSSGALLLERDASVCVLRICARQIFPDHCALLFFNFFIAVSNSNC